MPAYAQASLATGAADVDIVAILDQIERVIRIGITVVAAYLVALWIACIWWTFRDIKARTNDLFLQLAATLLVTVFSFPGLLIYLILRPPHMPNISIVDPGLYAVAWVIGLFLVNGYAFEIPSSRAQSAIAVIKATPFAGLAGVLAFFFDPYVMTRPLIVVSTLRHIP